MSRACRPYEEVTSDELGQLAAHEMSYRFEPPDDPDDILISGPCPRCRQPMTYEWPLSVVRYAVVSNAQDTLPVTVICRCEGDHDGAGRERGCGAYWTLLLPRPE